MSDGLPSNQVYCALQDHEGFMWFGTDAGVSRFDGTEFVNYSTTDGLTDNEIIGIKQDSRHRVWFLTLNGTFCYWLDGAFHNAGTDEDLGRFRGSSGWHSFVEDGRGLIWFGGIQGELVRLDPDGPLDSSYTSRGRTIVALGIDSALLLRNTSGLFIGVGDGFDLIHRIPPDLLHAALPTNALASRAPVMIAGSTVVELHRTGMRPLLPPDIRIDPWMNKACWRDELGNIWLNRRNNGIDLIALSGEGFAPIRTMFDRMLINIVYPASGGNYWFCTPDQGVLLVTEQAMKGTQVHVPTVPEREVFFSMALDDERIWLGTDRGSIFSYTGKGLDRKVAQTEEYLRGRVLRMELAPDDVLWYAGDFGLGRAGPWPSGEQQLIPWLDERSGVGVLEHLAAKSVHVGPTGSIWTGGFGLMQVVSHGGIPVRRSLISGEGAMYRSYCIHEDVEGQVWSERSDRIMSYRQGVWQDHALETGLGISRITDIVGWGRDTLALATTGGGVLLWSRGRTIHQFMPKDGLVSSMIRRIRIFGDTLWAASAQGISALVIRSGEVVDHWRWSTTEGYPSNNVYDLLVWRGRLHAATNEGLCISELRPLPRNVDAPRLHLARLAVNDSAVDRGGSLILRKDEDQLFVEVHAIEYALSAFVEYGYRLDGGPDWSPCVQGRVLMDRLEEGAHRVEVRARIARGPWSVSLEVPFEVRPVWWASRAMRTFAAFAVVSVLLFGMYHWSRREYRRKLAVLRAQQVLNEERRRIAADVHDDLGADLSRVLLYARQAEAGEANGTSMKITQGITSTIDKIDEIIWSLDPRRDTLQSTVHFIEQQARELAEANGLQFRTSVMLPESDMPLTAQQRRELLLIAREAMRNVVEHACARMLRIGWVLRNAQVVLRIEDDGIGMQEGAESGGRNGLANMRQRAGRLGGSIRFLSNVSGGTCVEVVISLHQNHPIE